MADQNERAPDYPIASTNAPPPPPPAYHDSTTPSDNNNANNNLPGETYYQPPELNETYPPPPIQNIPETTGHNRLVAYYTPEDRRIMLRRRIFSCFCCFMVLSIIIGLSVGLTRNFYYSSRYCECQTNADCVAQYGQGVYCAHNCECAIRF